MSDSGHPLSDAEVDRLLREVLKTVAWEPKVVRRLPLIPLAAEVIAKIKDDSGYA